MTRRLLWSTPWRPERTIAFAAIGTRHVIGLVGAHNLPGLTGATPDGSTWQVSHLQPGQSLSVITPPTGGAETRNQRRRDGCGT